MKLGNFSRYQKERRSDSDRRSGGDRRQASGSAEGGERRESGERRIGDRRIMRYGVRFATTRSIIVIEDFLDAECKGDWHVFLEGIDDNLAKKKVRLMFELEEDKNLFLERFRK